MMKNQVDPTSIEFPWYVKHPRGLRRSDVRIYVGILLKGVLPMVVTWLVQPASSIRKIPRAMFNAWTNCTAPNPNHICSVLVNIQTSNVSVKPVSVEQPNMPCKYTILSLC